jgi:hypothetical protein
VLVITAAVLFYVALTDFKQFKVRNELIFALAGLLRRPRAVVRWASAHCNGLHRPRTALAFANLIQHEQTAAL